MAIFYTVDQLTTQLLIVPFVTIGFGILASYLVKKLILVLIVAPIVTFLLNVLYQIWYWKHYYPKREVTFDSWLIIFPIFSFIFSLVMTKDRKYNLKLFDKLYK